MSEFQSEFDVNHPDVVSSIDDLPLWSAPFGLKLLDVVEMRRGIKALDVGCGFGFPLVDMSQRLGPTCTMVGIDPWKAALDRTRHKLCTWGVTNAEVIEGVAEAIPFGDATFDLVVSNNGTNNVDDEPRAFAEIARVAKPGAQFVFTLNLPDTAREFYDVYRAVLHERGDAEAAERMEAHIARKRKSIGEVRAMAEEAGFDVKAVHEDRFRFRYTDAAAMLNHFFLRLGFTTEWNAIIESEQRDDVFAEIGRRLDETVAPGGGVQLTIPWICVDCRRRHAAD